MKRILFIITALLPFALTAQHNKPKEAGTISGTATLLSLPNFTGDITLNYVRTIQPTQPVTSAGLGGLRDMGSRTVEQTTYMDGFMRPLQIVIKKPINNYTKDLVKFYNYNASGLITEDILPFVKADRTTAAAGKFDKKVYDDLIFTYHDLGYPDDDYPFTRTVYEQSLLGRATETRGQGAPWTGMNRGVNTHTRTGNSTDDIKKFNISYTAGSFPTYAGAYASADLIVTTTTDEDQLTSASYYNTQGLLVATENQDQRTYYVYDIYNQLRCVIPPKAVEALVATSWSPTTDIVNNLCFQYDYDNKGRQISIKKPGVDATYYRYDVHGRVIFTQDAIQRGNGQWVFSKYDVHGRVIQQGLFNTTSAGVTPSLEPETVLPSSSLHPFITYIYHTPVYHSSDYGYTFNHADFMIHYYFDDYSFITGKLNGAYTPGQLEFAGSVAAATEGYHTTMAEHPRGLLTGIYTAVSNNAKWIAHVNYYNSDGLLIQTISDDLENKLSVSASGYDFRGLLTKTVFQNNDATIQKKYSYDNYGRLRYIHHKIGNATSYRRIATYDYDAIGRTKTRQLGQMNYTEVFDYNIRNWITGINKTYARVKTDGMHFGEELFYENGYDERYFNGRLSGMQWRARGSEYDQRSYGYIYDNKQRLIMADYYQLGDKDWVKDDKDFTTNISYDAGGNITNMKHLGVDAAKNKIVLDDLTYQYEPTSNRLALVSESSESQSKDPNQYDGLGDFRDVSGLSQEYAYDANSNVTSDANRNISSITTNWFTINKPLQVNMGNGSTVNYVYDAMGNQLRKYTTWLDMTMHEKKTDYVGELIYENGNVHLIGHDEGRIRPVPDPATGLITYEYDYYLKDHLQNIRAIITEKVVQGVGDPEGVFDPATYNPSTSSGGTDGPVSYDVDPVGYIATSEPTNAAWETDLFDRVNETRGTRPANSDPKDQYAAVLNAAASRVVGPGKLLKVMAGDRIQLGAEAFFYSDQNPGNPVPINTIASQVIAALSGAAAISGEISNVFSQAMINSEMVGMALNDIKTDAPDDTTAPSAYLNYLVFDEGFNILKDVSGALQVSQANAWQQMEVPQFQINQNGYVYVFTSNQSQATVNTDNLYIYHWTSVLLEEFHYYPYGLTFEVNQQMNLPGSSVRYNSQSIERNEFTAAGGNQQYGLNWYDFMARSYDPQLGRWMQTDPMMQHASPYLAMSNNPTIFTDPLGLYDGHPDYYTVNGGAFTGHWLDPFQHVGDMTNDELMNRAWGQGGGGGSGGAMGGKVNLQVNYSDDVKRRRSQLDQDDANRKSLEKDLAKGWVEPANKWNGGVGVLAGAAENLTGRAAIGSNLKIYRSGWLGNQYVSTMRVAKIGKVMGYGTLLVGTAVDVRGVYNYYNSGAKDPNAVHPAKAGTNLSVGLWGLLSPATAIGAAAYYGIDSFYPGGFPAAMERMGEIEQRHREMTGQGLLSGPKY